MHTDLPIGEVLAELKAALGRADSVVLEAPPGAGKTTVVPLALLDSDWLGSRKILMLEPRRMAARAAAERMASTLGEKAGETVGYRVRLDSKISKATRIEVITEGILTRMLQTDPALAGVACLIFDEFHERSLDSDLGLALALQGRELFREGDPLKLLVMSATLDGAGIAELLGGAPLVSSQGKQFPVSVHYGAAWKPRENTVERVLACLREIVSKPETGSVLVFLPGQGEIRRVAQQLPSFENVIVAPLYGGLSLAQQQQAIAPAEDGQRKIVLATNIAETSLTIDGITTVVDSGLAREPRFDPATGMTRLQTRRIAQDSATQRMGRAGRLQAGYCYRLWSEEQQTQLAPRSTPEILQADLAPLALQLLAWGVADPAELRWLDLPPAGPWSQALQLLREFGALPAAGSWALSEVGTQMAQLPLHPRLAHMLVLACRWGMVDIGCDVAALLSERDPFSQRGADIGYRLLALEGEVAMPKTELGWLHRVKLQSKQYRRLCKFLPHTTGGGYHIGQLLAAAYPDRIARRRQARGHSYLLANGRSAALDPADALCSEEWLAVAEVGGRAGQAEDRIYSAAALDVALFEQQLAERVESRERVEWDDRNERFVAERQRRIGAIVLSREPLADISAEARQQALLELVRERGLDLLPWTDELRQWQARVSLLHTELGEPWPDVSDTALLGGLETWLAPYLATVNKLGDFARLDLQGMLAALLPWPLPRELDELAPQRIGVPSGAQHRIDYCQSPPVLSVKLQEMFGCEATPTVARGKVALLIHLLSPARRPLQVTQDLASFWRGAYKEVRKEMQGRYPKHPWPEDPLQALATAKTKRRLQQQKPEQD
ncbi:MAG: ATP-dependent helicase HrpB [Halieaceae bacterium]